MLTLIKVAITGGLACGKTTVCNIFRELGAHVVDADDIVHQLLSQNTSIGQQVVALLGEAILTDGKIDRGKIAEKVFNDQRLLRALQNIIHPAVMEEIDRLYQKIKNQKNKTVFVAEIPLLFEIKGEQFFNYTIAVATDEKNALNRFSARYSKNSASHKSDYIKRMSQQLPLEEKMRRADYVINNSGSLTELRQQVLRIYQKITYT